MFYQQWSRGSAGRGSERAFERVSVETRIVGEKPEDALLPVFSSPFSALSRF